MTTEQLIEAKKAERKAEKLHVRITTDSEPFDYYPANEAAKAKFISDALAAGRTILVQ